MMMTAVCLHFLDLLSFHATFHAFHAYFIASYEAEKEEVSDDDDAAVGMKFESVVSKLRLLD